MSPIQKGSILAVLAAILFGCTSPILSYFGKASGPSTTACLLYVGALLASLPKIKTKLYEKAITQHIPRLILVALFGAALAPICLAWGLKLTSTLSASLLLNLEAIFTVLFAWIVFRETIGTRVIIACSLMLLGGTVLAFRNAEVQTGATAGMILIVLATIAWSLDNTLTRPLSELDTHTVVFYKSLFGALFSLGSAIVLSESWPTKTNAFVILLCGALGIGVSLHLYLLAQRILGAARTGSLFSIAPFVGATIAFVAGDRDGPIFITIASVCFAFGVWLHLTEKHSHSHKHLSVTHEHIHDHDDGHHSHYHNPVFQGSHSHPHTHEELEHEHDHGNDMHHQHTHE